MSDTKAQMLAWIVDASAPHASEQNPLGYCYIPGGNEQAATELHNDELIVALVTSRAADGSFACRPTELGVKWVQASRGTPAPPSAPAPAPVKQPEIMIQHGQQPHVPQTQAGQQHAAMVSGISVDSGYDVPAKRQFGHRSASGETVVDRYPFATLPVNGSFFVPQDSPPKRDEDGKEVLKHRSFANVVSQANKKLHPFNFVIREWKQEDGPLAGKFGARVWRLENMQGDRPVRPRKGKPVASAATAAQVQPPSPPAQGFGQPPFGQGGLGGSFPPPQLGPGTWGGAPAQQANPWASPPVGDPSLPPFGQ